MLRELGWAGRPRSPPPRRKNKSFVQMPFMAFLPFPSNFLSLPPPRSGQIRLPAGFTTLNSLSPVSKKNHNVDQIIVSNNDGEQEELDRRYLIDTTVLLF